MQKYYTLPLSLALTFGLAPAVLSQELPGTVVSIGDGDTLRLRSGTETLTIRLACLDSPEIGQAPYGQASRQRLQQLLPIGQPITVNPVDRDRFGRIVGEVRKGNLSINVALVQEGQAVVYRQYLKNCPTLEPALLKAEQTARSRKLGFWNQPNPVMPWDFRRSQRSGSNSSEPQPTPFTQPKTVGLPACVNSDCNCSDFQSQAQAQQVLKAFLGDPFGLDRDRDGIACESLR